MDELLFVVPTAGVGIAEVDRKGDHHLQLGQGLAEQLEEFGGVVFCKGRREGGDFRETFQSRVAKRGNGEELKINYLLVLDSYKGITD